MNIFLIIIVVHFLADFALQTHEQAMGKGEGWNFYNKWLYYHVSTYSLIWFIAILALTDSFKEAFIFTSITYISHYITDWFTSRIGKPFWSKNDYHNGFVVVGFDQVLHYVQLYYTFKLIEL
jgi:hypothetical protein